VSSVCDDRCDSKIICDFFIFFSGLRRYVHNKLAAAPRIEHVLPTVRLWTATQYDWSLMRGLWAAQTFGEMGYVLPGLSASGATATATDAWRGDRDVRGTIARPNESMQILDAF